MRLLVDECLSAQVSTLLSAAGHDAVHVIHVGLRGAGDVAVLSAVVDADRVLGTADTDVGAILALSGAAHPSGRRYRWPGRTSTPRREHLCCD